MRWQDSEWPQAAALVISILADVIDCLPPPLSCLVTESQPLRLRTTCSVPHWPREKFSFQLQTGTALSVFRGVLDDPSQQFLSGTTSSPGRWRSYSWPVFCKQPVFSSAVMLEKSHRTVPSLTLMFFSWQHLYFLNQP